MQRYDYLIIGGGMAGDAAVGGIRERDAHRSIGMISRESDPPYRRPPLTKALWKGKPLDIVWCKNEDKGVCLHLEREVLAIDAQRKTVTDNKNEVYEYGKLLLATGATPRQLPFGGEDITYFRTLNDYRYLRSLAAKKNRFAVIGSGFIGSELAAALAMNRKETVMIFRGNDVCGNMFPPALARFVSDYYRAKGVELWPGETLAALERKGDQLVLKTKSGRETTVDGVVAGLGIEPNTDLARKIGLRVEDGIVVDEWLRTSQPDIYAAGDVASFYNPALERRLRVEHDDNSTTMGYHAGKNMAGANEPYQHLPYFYSDLFDLPYEAVGEVDARLQTLADWKEPNREGVVYYIRDARVRGVLLWNVWEQVDAARELISAKAHYRAEDLKDKLPKAA